MVWLYCRLHKVQVGEMLSLYPVQHGDLADKVDSLDQKQHEVWAAEGIPLFLYHCEDFS